MALVILLRAVLHPGLPLFCGSQVLPPCRCSDLAAVAGVSAIITFVIVPSLARAFAGCTFPKQLADSPGQVHVRGSQTFGLLASSGQFCSKYGLVDKQSISSRRRDFAVLATSV